MTSSASLSLSSKIGGSQLGGSHSKLSIRNQSPFEKQESFDGPTLPYTITIRTGDERNCGNSSQVFIRLLGENKRLKTERINLQLAKKRRFEPGSAEVFQIEALDIGDLRQVEVCYH